MYPALISVGIALVCSGLACIFDGCRKNSAEALITVCEVGVGVWLVWWIVASIIWGWAGFAYAFFGQPIVSGTVLIIYTSFPTKTSGQSNNRRAA